MDKLCCRLASIPQIKISYSHDQKWLATKMSRFCWVLTEEIKTSNLFGHRDHKIVSTVRFITERQMWSPKVHSHHSLLARCSSWTRLSQQLLLFLWKDGMDQPQPDSAAVCFWLKWRPEFVQKDLVFWSMNDFSYTVCRRLSEVFQCPPVGFLFDAGYSSHECSANPPLWPVIPKTWETIFADENNL